MSLCIAGTSTDSLTKLTGDEQTSVKTTAFDLELNPANRDMSFYKIEKTRTRSTKTPGPRYVDNLPSILRDGGVVVRRGVDRAWRDLVGGYVPFYFCPRSIMLFLIHCANHPELTYRGGQGPILHLELDMQEVIAWADAHAQRWAFSLSNAGAYYSEFRNRADQLDQVNWPAVAATDFRDPAVKEGKQAEFLVQTFVPWSLVRRIGVLTATVQNQAMRHTAGAAHRPVAEVCRAWYF